MNSSQDVQFVPKHVIEEENSHNRYTFPKSRQGLQKVESKSQLDQILRDMFYVEFQAKGINIPYPYEIEQKARMTHIQSISKVGFTARCRICTNFLAYSKPIGSHSNMFNLQNFYSEHDHRLTQKRKIGYYDERIPLDYRTAKQKKIFLNLSKFTNSINDIQKCISELPINLTKRMRQRVICDKFKITKKQFVNIYLQQNQKKEIQFSAFVEDLNQKNYSYRYLPEDLLKQNPKITRKFNQPTVFSVNPLNHERKDDIFRSEDVNGCVPEIDIDGKNNIVSSNMFISQKNSLLDQPKTKGNFPLIDPNTDQIPKSQTNNNNPSTQPTGLNGNNSNIPLYKINPHVIDPNNPNLPNVLLIISPAMKQMYKKYGQYMGFDLTFSLIRQQPTHTEKEYLVGVFASKNESFRIVIFGLVITNNQSAAVYKWLFKNFIQIMGKQPQTIITDEQVAIGKALRQLKQQGFYHGHHLLDTFHVLTKFRKSVQSQTFQYLRKLIHAKDKYEYKAIFQQCKNQLTSDDEIKVLQEFDYHCEKYCYAHIPPTFVGFGVSDAMNESFHNILKDKIPYEIKYLKAVNIILPFLEQRNEIGTLSLICQIPYEQKLGFPFLKPYRKIVSDRLFFYLINQCSKGITHSIVLDDGKYQNHECQKIEESEGKSQKQQRKSLQLRNSLQKSKFQIVTREGICLVWKQKIPQVLGPIDESQVTCDSSTNYWSQYPQLSTYITNIYPYSSFQPHLPSQTQYKWRCICQMEQKAGMCCSHILKVLILRNQSLLPYIHPRWFVREENIFEGLKSMMNTTLKYVTNITTDMNNMNRLKYIRLRDKYLCARNNIKKQLQEIADVKIPTYQEEVNHKELYSRRKLMLNNKTNQKNQEKPKQIIEQEYMEWVSANDQTIKMQKQKYFKILEKKRKAEIKRLRKEKGLPEKEYLHEGVYVNNATKYQKSQYTDYVYLKPREFKQLSRSKSLHMNKNQLQQQIEEQSSSSKVVDEIQQVEKSQEEQWRKYELHNQNFDDGQYNSDEYNNSNLHKQERNNKNYHITNLNNQPTEVNDNYSQYEQYQNLYQQNNHYHLENYHHAQRIEQPQQKQYDFNEPSHIQENQQLSKMSSAPKKRGRPRIHPIKQKPSLMKQQLQTPGKKKRGRPRKVQEQQNIIQSNSIPQNNKLTNNQYKDSNYGIIDTSRHQQYQQFEYEDYDEQAYYE